ncbi:hypothetical protein BS50DRAFT_491406 [Corynespora cassiicola Philippines]|uniref:Alpha/beta hydrolase fold-3 domain-containing protein n=1 Tax=Corynespora cassiicola Philippines TaxID=1448308 RepID=A0A2T2NQB8_CORCC|nr:hypothetical protein BS50DRAFT_491406 [Corynespora cassiicola Philippines]
MKMPEPTLPDDVSLNIMQVISADGTRVPVYHYRKNNSAESHSTTAAVVHAHGGGMILLSAAAMIDSISRLVHDTGVQFFSVDYRLAPEHSYPAALEDCWTCLTHLHSNAEALGIDPKRIGVMGESAGGNLAAALTLKARDQRLSPPIAQQILVYPMLDDRNTDDPDVFSLWNGDDNLTGWTAYLGKAPGGDNVPIYAAPGRIADATSLPPLYLDVGQLDIYIKENLEYVRKFIEAGIDTEFHVHPGLPHGWDGLAPAHSVNRQFVENRKRVLKNL